MSMIWVLVLATFSSQPVVHHVPMKSREACAAALKNLKSPEFDYYLRRESFCLNTENGEIVLITKV